MSLIVINFRETEASMKNLVPCSSSFQRPKLAHWTRNAKEPESSLMVCVKVWVSEQSTFLINFLPMPELIYHLK